MVRGGGVLVVVVVITVVNASKNPAVATAVAIFWFEFWP